MTTLDSSRQGSFAARFAARVFSAAAAVVFASSAQAAIIYSWETGLEGWSANTGAGYSAATTSALGVTDGTSAVVLSAPSSDMWSSAGFSRGLDAAERTQIFANATQLGLDVTYNPGSDTWYLDASVKLIVQGSNVGWTELSSVPVLKGTTPTLATWSISSTLASDLATSTWAQIFIGFTYGNGGSAPSLLYFDNFTSDASAIPEPSSFALVLGLAAVGGVAMRRRRRA